MGNNVPEWIIRIIIAQLAKLITPELIAALKAQALEAIKVWAQKLPAGLAQVAVAIAEAFFNDDHNAATKAIVCWAKNQATNSVNKIDDAVVAVLADALGVDPNTCPVPTPTP